MLYIPHPNQPSDFDVQEYTNAYNNYYMYLDSIRGKLTSSAYEFAVAEWHYNFHDPRCPHDSWVEELTIREISEVERAPVHERETEITLRLLGAYHDGYILLKYHRVHSYSFKKSGHPYYLSRSMSHGDWLVDEVRLSDYDLVLHEIEFESSTWLIECENLIYEWQPFA